MRRMISLGMFSLAGLVGATAAVDAQVWVRAPFVRVGVGPGVYVRAPFVNLWIPPPPPPYFVPPPGYVPPPAPGTVPPAQNPPATTPQAPPQGEVPPPPRSTANNPLSVQDFIKSFQAREGSYNVTLINPVSKQPATVRFTLPAGTPRRTIVRADEIEFFYGLRHFVRIQFDQDGATVISR